MGKPNLFIVGAPRCGTTSLWSYLKNHPEIFMSTPKELYFFDSDLWAGEVWAPSLEQYLGYFSAAGERKKIGEATPSYLCSRHAPRKIKAFSPEAQIIIMLRNPVDVMYSLHSQALCYSTEPIDDFETALRTDTRRTGRELIGYRQFTDFPEHVQRYFDVFGRENVHTIIYDDLKDGSAAVCQNLLRFLGVRLDFTAEFPRVNQNKQVRNTHLETIVVRPPRTLRAISRLLAPQWLRSQVRRTLLDTNRTVAPRPAMDPGLRKRLQKECQPKVEQLSELLGRDLSEWCKETDAAERGKDDREPEGVAHVFTQRAARPLNHTHQRAVFKEGGPIRE